MNDEHDIEEYAPWLLLGIILLGGGLRFFMLATKSLSLEETFSLWLANHNLTDLLPWVARIDHHPPLYYLLLHYWIALFGEVPYYARLLSALFGVATIPMVYLIGKRLSGPMVGLGAAALLAFSPFNIRYGQDTRMYTCFMFMIAVATYALVRLLADPRARKPIGSQFLAALRHPQDPSGQGAESDSRDLGEFGRLTGWRAIVFHRWKLPWQRFETDLSWAALIVFSAAAMLSHNLGVLFLLAANVYVGGLMLFHKIKKPGPEAGFQAPSFWNWVIAQVGIFILWSPWLATFIRQARAVYQEFWIPAPTWQSVLYTMQSFFNEATFGPSSQVKALWYLYALVLALGLVHFRKKLPRLAFLLTLFAVPILVELIVSLRRPVFLDRTLIWVTIPLFLILGAGIAQFRLRFLMIAILGILSSVNLFYAGDYYRFWQKEDWGYAAGYLANLAQKDDLVLFNTARAQIPFDYYFTPYQEQYSLVVQQHGVPVDLVAEDILEARMADSDLPGLLVLVSGRSRVWLVYSHNGYTDPDGLILQTLRSEMEMTRQRDFYGVQVLLFEAR